MLGIGVDRQFESTLLRAATELFARSYRIKKYLTDVSPSELGEHEQLIKTVRTAIAGIEGTVVRTLEAITASRSGTGSDFGAIPPESLKVLHENLARFSKWFLNIHELLVYLPQQAVSPETTEILDDGFRDAYKEQKPTVLLGSIFNAFEFDFYEIVKQKLPDINKVITEEPKNTVLQLAICDKESPLAWAILAHELGHTVDSEKQISENVLKNLSSSIPFPHWCREICADLIAAETLGPSPIAAILSMEYIFYPLRTSTIYASNPTHPTTKWRLKIVSDYLRSKYQGEDFLSGETADYEAAWELSLRSAFPDPKAQARERDKDAVVFESLIEPMATQIGQLIPSLGLPTRRLDRESIGRCITRLGDGLPISAQGRSRSELRTLLSEYESKAFDSEPKRTAAFYALVDQFQEVPLGIPSMMTAGQERRRMVILDAVQSVDSMASTAGVERLCMDLAKIDSLLASSIRTSSVHKLQARAST